MDINDVYVSKSEYLAESDLKGKRVNVKIVDAEAVKLGEDEKIALIFESTEKKLALNKTNARMIAHLFDATDTREWIGKIITLRPDMTDYQGKSVPCIRVDSIVPDQAMKTKAAPKDDDGDSEIPF